LTKFSIVDKVTKQEQMMDIELDEEEMENLILVMVDQLQQNLPCPENGVESKWLASNLEMELDEVKKRIQKLRMKRAVSYRFEQTGGGQFFINPTEKTLEYLEKLNTLTINETSKIILEKSYDFYKRAGYDSTIQLNSAIIGSVIGFTNSSKINSALEMLEDEGLIKNPAVMLNNTIYFLSAKGINMIENKQEKQTKDSVAINDIFIVHGRNEGIKAEVANFLRKLNLEPIILHEQANQGKTIIEKFEKYSNAVAAIALFTADDIGKYQRDNDYETRVRQNVIFETGYFIGKLGRENTIILHENGLKIPSDLDGYIYIPLDENKRWHLDLAKELMAIGFTIDINNL
jgi:predicted nucleotide-binding protein